MSFARLRLNCPHCGDDIAIDVGVELQTARKWEPDREADDWRLSRTPEQIAVVEHARSSGVLEAFTVAVHARQAANGQPKSMESFLLTFLSSMRQNRVPHFVLKHYIREFGHGTISIWSAQGVLAVVADGRLRAFVPLEVVRGQSIVSVSGLNKSRIGGDEDSFQAWVKTRNGYVPAGARVFLDEMRGKSFGEFAKPSL
jgi:hypothetical protein